MDTGATAHMFAHPSNLASFTPVSTDRRIIVGDGSTLPITHVGHTSFPSTSTPLSMSNILVSPHLIKNLISVRYFTRENPVTVEFDEFGFSVKDARTRMVLHRCDNLDELYTVHSLSTSTTAPVALSAGVDIWHARLGHPNPVTLRHISFSCHKIKDHTCHACRVANMFASHLIIPPPLLLSLFS